MWAGRWSEQWPDTIDIASSQSVRERFPEIPGQWFDQAVVLIEADGTARRGAEAVFRTRALGGGHRLGSWLYEHVPGFAATMEFCYRIVARNRPVFSALTRWGWGANVSRPRFAIATEAFLRVLALVYAIAFLSFWVQLPGLIGPQGILPAEQYMPAVAQQLGASRWYVLPSLCWIFGSGWFLHVLCGVGLVLAAGVFFNRLRPWCLVGLWLAWLSLAAPAEMFLRYQWDALLLEAGFLAIFITPWRANDGRPEPPRAARWMLGWLLLRLMLWSGLVKWTSGDPTWHNFTALSYHYETQPLPTWVGWWVAQAPGWFQRLSCFAMFAIELGGPFLLLGPRRVRLLGVGLLVGLQLVIALTGNYTYFNLLAIALCLLFLDDAWWSRRFGLAPDPHRRPPSRGFLARPALAALFVLTFAFTLLEGLPDLSPRFAPPPWLERVFTAAGGFGTLNTYGLFRVMTTQRPEIIFEGSDDGYSWEAYEFPAKAGELARRPVFVEPHQPRLDWQLWFAALAYPQRERWVLAFMERLLQGRAPVLGLLRHNPFPKRPPRFVRAVLYQYNFTTPAERARTGNWWRRTPIDIYIPPQRLP